MTATAGALRATESLENTTMIAACVPAIGAGCRPVLAVRAARTTTGRRRRRPSGQRTRQVRGRVPYQAGVDLAEPEQRGEEARDWPQKFVASWR
jgi:hypothetical protein